MLIMPINLVNRMVYRASERASSSALITQCNRPPRAKQATMISSRPSNPMMLDSALNGPTMLYVVVHTRVSTPTRLISHDAARRNLVGDLFVAPPRPIKVGMYVQVVEIRAMNEATLDGSKNRKWRIIPGTEVRGRLQSGRLSST